MSSYNTLQELLATHVAIITVIRRNPKPNRGPNRRFLATNNYLLLNSIPGKSVFHFKAPRQYPPFNAKSKNLITAFDLLMQKYRNINLETDKIIDMIPVRNEKELTEFWQWFYDSGLYRWNSGNKSAFMNNVRY